ncbi:MAG: prephenate dehydrogenase/arogenate dehydrogenase family protein [Candidatus Hydrogenedentes bacterium]|nr:prephenate dehydrogenase/arogenate dehydrogenase family protein [Candidatus Hydrogenedentota bacterium]
MTAHFNTAAIVGVGLLGGSLGLALKARRMADRVYGIGRRQESLDTALKLGAVDKTFLDLSEGIRGADLIVLCTPAALVAGQLDTIASLCDPSAVVTDVASTKAEICAHARATWRQPLRFVGSHPMAGSEKYGPEHATDRLYENCVTLVECANGHAADAHEVVCGLWKGVGARVVEIDPAVHDALVARSSHIPHIASSLVASLAGNLGDIRSTVGKGFRDVTRVAGGRPEIWRDICLTNREAISEGLAELAKRLDAVRAMIAESDGNSLDAFFAEAQLARKKALGE